MEEIIIKKQRQMTFAETLDFCISSIRHRFMRSLLTLSVVILAVAFFMFLQCSNIFRNSVKEGVEKEILESRKAARILNMLYASITEKDFVSMLVDARKSPGDFDRLAKMLGKDQKQMQTFVDNAAQEMIYLRFFEKLPFGKRKALFGQNKDSAQLEMLLKDGSYDEFLKKTRELGGIRIPGGEDKLKTYLDGYKAYRTELKQSFAKLQAVRNDKAFPARATDGKELKERQVLAKHLLDLNAQKQINQQWRDKLAALNVFITDDETKMIVDYLDVQERTNKVKMLLSNEAYRIRWRQVYGKNQYSRMDEKLAHLDTNKTWRVFNEAPSQQKRNLRELQHVIYFGGNPDEVKKLPDDQLKLIPRTDLESIRENDDMQKELQKLELQLDINTLDDAKGFTPDQIYLMCLSFLVCVVGITNAMLMSITERFREIATLKCLGATDSFILIQIVLEAMIQGVIGGVIGLILGFIVALSSSVFQVGLRVFASFDWSMIGFAALFSLLAGVLLSVLSSLYPSAKAARMAPMEAMRVE